MGTTHRIIKNSVKNQRSGYDVEFLLSCAPEKLSHNLSQFYTRPAYQYTKAEVGGLE